MKCSCCGCNPSLPLHFINGRVDVTGHLGLCEMLEHTHDVTLGKNICPLRTFLSRGSFGSLRGGTEINGFKICIRIHYKTNNAKRNVIGKYPAFTSLRTGGVACALGLANTLFCLTKAGVFMDSSEIKENTLNAKVN